MAQQLSVFLENAPGQLKKLTNVLGENEINMHALFVTDTSDSGDEFGMARIICDRTEEAATALRAEGFSLTITELIAVEIPNTPGALGTFYATMAEAGLDVSYAYCLVDPATKQAINFCRFKSHNAASAIEDAGFKILGDNVFHG